MLQIRFPRPYSRPGHGRRQILETSSRSLVEITDLTVRYGGTVALEGVDFRIAEGEVVTLVGPNGSGKSTLLRAIRGCVKPARGSIARAQDLRIGYVPQRLTLDPTLQMTVGRFLGLPRHVAADRAADTLSRAGLSDLGDRQLAALSGGQFQRALLARALLGKPDLLVLDEATAGLDQPGAAEFYERIEHVRATTGCAVLMVGHDLHVVMSASDRVVCLNGRICCEGRPEIVTDAPEYRSLFGNGTGGTIALCRHRHDAEDHEATS